MALPNGMAHVLLKTTDVTSFITVFPGARDTKNWIACSNFPGIKKMSGNGFPSHASMSYHMPSLGGRRWQ